MAAAMAATAFAAVLKEGDAPSPASPASPAPAKTGWGRTRSATMKMKGLTSMLAMMQVAANTRGSDASQGRGSVDVDSSSRSAEGEGAVEPLSFTPLERMNPYLRLYRALLRVPDRRTPRDLVEIAAALGSVPDPFLTRLADDVRRQLAARVVLQEPETGTQLFDMGDRADRLYIIWNGAVQVEVPKDSLEVRAMSTAELEKVPAPKVHGSGVVFGEMDPGHDDDPKRAGRATVTQNSQLLSLQYEDVQRCLGIAQDSVIQDRVAFLRSADKGVLGDVPEADLRAIAAHLHERTFTGEKEILRQGDEVDRIILVRRGTCKVVRRVSPRYARAFSTFAEGPPAGNPFMSTARVRTPSRRGQGGRSAESRADLDRELDLGFHPKLNKMLQDFERRRRDSAGVDERAAQSPEWRRSLSPGSEPECGAQRARAAASSAGDAVVQILQGGRFFGVMETMEGTTYQYAVVAAPWAEVYTIGKQDLLRNISKTVLHKLFCDYKACLADERLVQRMMQKSRWTSYKRDLLDEILTRRTAGGNLLTRDDKTSRRPGRGTGRLDPSAYERVGKGEELWDRRASTPPRSVYTVDSPQPTGAGSLPLSSKGAGAYQIGDRVQVQGQDARSWRTGRVVGVDPLKVQPEGWDKGYAWEKVRPAVTMDDKSGNEELLANARIISILLKIIESGRSLYGRRVTNVRSFFDALDRDGSGDLEKEEVMRGIQRLGVPLNQEEISRFLGMLDRSGDGSLDFEEMSDILNLTGGQLRLLSGAGGGDRNSSQHRLERRRGAMTSKQIAPAANELAGEVEVQHIFKVKIVTKPDGTRDVDLQHEEVDSSMLAMQAKLDLTVAASRHRDKLRMGQGDTGGESRDAGGEEAKRLSKMGLPEGSSSLRRSEHGLARGRRNREGADSTPARKGAGRGPASAREMRVSPVRRSITGSTGSSPRHLSAGGAQRGSSLGAGQVSDSAESGGWNDDGRALEGDASDGSPSPENRHGSPRSLSEMVRRVQMEGKPGTRFLRTVVLAGAPSLSAATIGSAASPGAAPAVGARHQTPA